MTKYINFEKISSEIRLFDAESYQTTHLHFTADSLDPLVKAATLLRLFSLPNGVFHLQFSNKKHYNLVLTTHLRYKKKILQLPAFTFNHNYFPLFTLIYVHISLSTFLSSTFLCFHVPLSTFISVHWPSSTFIFLHLTYSTFIYLHRHLPFIEIYLCAFVYFHRPAFVLKYLHLFQLSIQQYLLPTIYLIFFSSSTFIDLYLLSFLFIFLCLSSAFLSYHHCPSLSFFIPSLTFIVLYLSPFILSYNYLSSSHRFTSLSSSWL